jgi:hypothetical protein
MQYTPLRYQKLLTMFICFILLIIWQLTTIKRFIEKDVFPIQLTLIAMIILHLIIFSQIVLISKKEPKDGNDYKNVLLKNDAVKFACYYHFIIIFIMTISILPGNPTLIKLLICCDWVCTFSTMIIMYLKLQ